MPDWSDLPKLQGGGPRFAPLQEGKDVDVSGDMAQVEQAFEASAEERKYVQDTNNAFDAANEEKKLNELNNQLSQLAAVNLADIPPNPELESTLQDITNAITNPPSLPEPPPPPPDTSSNNNPAASSGSPSDIFGFSGSSFFNSGNTTSSSPFSFSDSIQNTVTSGFNNKTAQSLTNPSVSSPNDESNPNNLFGFAGSDDNLDTRTGLSYQERNGSDSTSTQMPANSPFALPSFSTLGSSFISTSFTQSAAKSINEEAQQNKDASLFDIYKTGLQDAQEREKQALENFNVDPSDPNYLEKAAAVAKASEEVKFYQQQALGKSPELKAYQEAVSGMHDAEKFLKNDDLEEEERQQLQQQYDYYKTQAAKELEKVKNVARDFGLAVAEDGTPVSNQQGIVGKLMQGNTDQTIELNTTQLSTGLKTVYVFEEDPEHPGEYIKFEVLSKDARAVKEGSGGQYGYTFSSEQKVGDYYVSGKAVGDGSQLAETSIVGIDGKFSKIKDNGDGSISLIPLSYRDATESDWGTRSPELQAAMDRYDEKQTRDLFIDTQERIENQKSDIQSAAGGILTDIGKAVGTVVNPIVISLGNLAAVTFEQSFKNTLSPFDPMLNSSVTDDLKALEKNRERAEAYKEQARAAYKAGDYTLANKHLAEANKILNNNDTYIKAVTGITNEQKNLGMAVVSTIPGVALGGSVGIVGAALVDGAASAGAQLANNVTTPGAGNSLEKAIEGVGTEFAVNALFSGLLGGALKGVGEIASLNRGLDGIGAFTSPGLHLEAPTGTVRPLYAGPELAAKPTDSILPVEGGELIFPNPGRQLSSGSSLPDGPVIDIDARTVEPHGSSGSNSDFWSVGSRSEQGLGGLNMKGLSSSPQEIKFSPMLQEPPTSVEVTSKVPSGEPTIPPGKTGRTTTEIPLESPTKNLNEPASTQRLDDLQTQKLPDRPTVEMESGNLVPPKNTELGTNYKVSDVQERIAQIENPSKNLQEYQKRLQQVDAEAKSLKNAADMGTGNPFDFAKYDADRPETILRNVQEALKDPELQKPQFKQQLDDLTKYRDELETLVNGKPATESRALSVQLKQLDPAEGSLAKTYKELVDNYASQGKPLPPELNPIEVQKQIEKTLNSSTVEPENVTDLQEFSRQLDTVKNLDNQQKPITSFDKNAETPLETPVKKTENATVETETGTATEPVRRVQKDTIETEMNAAQNRFEPLGPDATIDDVIQRIEQIPKDQRNPALEEYRKRLEKVDDENFDATDPTLSFEDPFQSLQDLNQRIADLNALEKTVKKQIAEGNGEIPDTPETRKLSELFDRAGGDVQFNYYKRALENYRDQLKAVVEGGSKLEAAAKPDGWDLIKIKDQNSKPSAEAANLSSQIKQMAPQKGSLLESYQKTVDAAAQQGKPFLKPEEMQKLIDQTLKSHSLDPLNKPGLQEFSRQLETLKNLDNQQKPVTSFDKNADTPLETPVKKTENATVETETGTATEPVRRVQKDTIETETAVNNTEAAELSSQIKQMAPQKGSLLEGYQKTVDHYIKKGEPLPPELKPENMQDQIKKTLKNPDLEAGNKARLQEFYNQIDTLKTLEPSVDLAELNSVNKSAKEPMTSNAGPLAKAKQDAVNPLNGVGIQNFGKLPEDPVAARRAAAARGELLNPEPGPLRNYLERIKNQDPQTGFAKGDSPQEQLDHLQRIKENPNLSPEARQALENFEQGLIKIRDGKSFYAPEITSPSIKASAKPAEEKLTVESKRDANPIQSKKDKETQDDLIKPNELQTKGDNSPLQTTDKNNPVDKTINRKNNETVETTKPEPFDINKPAHEKTFIEGSNIYFNNKNKIDSNSPSGQKLEELYYNLRNEVDSPNGDLNNVQKLIRQMEDVVANVPPSDLARLSEVSPKLQKAIEVNNAIKAEYNNLRKNNNIPVAEEDVKGFVEAAKTKSDETFLTAAKSPGFMTRLPNNLEKLENLGSGADLVISINTIDPTVIPKLDKLFYQDFPNLDVEYKVAIKDLEKRSDTITVYIKNAEEYYPQAAEFNKKLIEATDGARRDIAGSLPIGKNIVDPTTGKVIDGLSLAEYPSPGNIEKFINSIKDPELRESVAKSLNLKGGFDDNGVYYGNSKDSTSAGQFEAAKRVVAKQSIGTTEVNFQRIFQEAPPQINQTRFPTGENLPSRSP